MNTKTTIQAAIAGLVTLGFAAAGNAGPVTPKEGQEQCGGITKKGANDCGTDKHACASLSKTDNDKSEWKWVAKGTCEKSGGVVIVAKKK